MLPESKQGLQALHWDKGGSLRNRTAGEWDRGTIQVRHGGMANAYGRVHMTPRWGLECAWGGVVKKLGIPPFQSPCRRWTPQEEALLGTAPDTEIAARLGRHIATVCIRRQELGIPNAYWQGRLGRQRGRKKGPLSALPPPR